jgi:uncharacterized protein YdhG (YjbR/CyaY superfamily)
MYPDNQKAINRTQIWLTWTKTMFAKPNKCVSLAFKMFQRNIKKELYIPISDTLFSAFDPCLQINNQPIRFLVNPQDDDIFKSEHFKFLGRWINGRNLSEELVRRQS